MLSALGNVPTLEKPALWNKAPLSIEDSKFVQQYYKEKASEFDNKYDFKLQDLDCNDKVYNSLIQIVRYTAWSQEIPWHELLR